MPLTLNLLHEEQKLAQARQRDPLKLGILALIGVALLFVGYYFYCLIGASALSRDLRIRQAEWAKQQPLSLAALTQEKELNSSLGAATAVTRRIEGRFYWAPLLDTLQHLVPPSIQIAGFSGNNELSGEKVSLGLDGIAAGAEPRAAAEQFRTALAETLGKKFPGATATFRSLEESPGMANLEGKALPTAKFAIDVQLKKPPFDAASPAPRAAAK